MTQQALYSWFTYVPETDFEIPESFDQTDSSNLRPILASSSDLFPRIRSVARLDRSRTSLASHQHHRPHLQASQASFWLCGCATAAPPHQEVEQWVQKACCFKSWSLFLTSQIDPISCAAVEPSHPIICPTMLKSTLFAIDLLEINWNKNKLERAFLFLSANIIITTSPFMSLSCFI